MFGSRSAWAQVLEVSLDGLDERTLKRAYARKLKTIDPVEDPESFQTLREAFEGLKRFAPKTPRAPRTSEPDIGTVEPEAPAADGEEVAGPSAKPESESPPDDDNDSDRPEPPAPAKDPTPKPIPLPPQTAPMDQAPLRSQAEEASRLVRQVNMLIKSPWAGGKWASVLDDPAMRDLATADQVERALYNQIMRHMMLDQGEEDTLPATLDGDALDLIEERFAWFSDVTRLQKKFGGQSQRLVTALVTDPNRPRTQALTKGYRDKWSNIPRMTRAQRIDRILTAPWFFSSLLAAISIWALVDSVLPYLAP